VKSQSFGQARKKSKTFAPRALAPGLLKGCGYNKKMITQVLIHGEGGQGIKLLSQTLAYILSKLEKQVTLTYEYDSNVRGGQVTAYLKYDDKKIENPLIEEADFLILLTHSKGFKGKTTVVEQKFKEGEHNTQVLFVPFETIARELGNLKFVNMVTLGYILKLINIDIEKLDIEHTLPEQLREENLNAIRQGYEFIERSNM